MFSNVKPGDVVHYSTPQGQYGKGKVVLRYDTHVVVNRGKGQPQVVNDKNYVKHERGGKVVGALLGKVAAHDKYLKGVASTKASNAVAKAVSPYKKVGDPQMNASKAFGWTKTNEAAKMSDDFLMVDMKKLKAAKATDAKRRAIKKAARNYGDARRVAQSLKKEEFGCHDAGSGCHATGDENKKKLKDYIKPKYVNAGRQKQKASEREAAKGRETIIRDTAPAYKRIAAQRKAVRLQGEASELGIYHGSRVSKKGLLGTKYGSATPFNNKGHVSVKWDSGKESIHHESELKALRSVDKGYWDNKKKKSVKEMRNPSGPYGGHPYDWDPTLRKQIMDAAAKKVKKLPGSPQPSKLDTGDTYKPAYKGPPPRRGTTSEDSRDVEAARQRISKTKNMKKRKKKLIKEVAKSTLINYITKARADRNSRGAAELGKLRTGMSKYYMDDEGANRKISNRSKGIKQAHARIAGNLPGERVNEVSALSKKIAREGGGPYSDKAVAYYQAKKKLSKKEVKSHWYPSRNDKKYDFKEEEYVHEARDNEWSANIHMAQGAGKAGKPAKGHYLMRDGRKLSGPHSPEEAVRAYKDMATGNKGDSKGVKIVHVKEGVEYNVTAILMEDKWSDGSKQRLAAERDRRDTQLARMDANRKKNKAVIVSHHKNMLEKGYKYTHSDGISTPFDGHDVQHHYTSADGKHKKIMSYSSYAPSYDQKIKPDYRKEKLSTNHPDLREATELHADLMEASEQKVKDTAKKLILKAKGKLKGQTANTKPELPTDTGDKTITAPMGSEDGVTNHA